MNVFNPTLRIRLLAGLLLLPVIASAATYNVTSISALQTRINAAVAGDIIILANGSYTTSAAISVNKVGTAANPIVIKAASVGGVTINGSHGFVFSSPAAYVTIEGFRFLHANSINMPAGTHHLRFMRNFVDLNIASGADVSYMNISGDDIEIGYNELANKNTLGNMLDITGSGSQVARRLWVHHNYFHDFTSPGGNGAETIRWGLSGLSLSDGDGLCEYNLFVRANGENEMISNKSSGNTYRYNTVLDSPGGEISQRHGDNCQYYGNYMRNTAGIRVYGDSHQIHSNYLEGNSIGINMGNGDGDVHNGAPLTAHDRPDNNVVTFNTLINNTTHYQMGGRTNGLGATNTTFANNIMQGGTTAVSISGTAPYTNPVWSGNIIWNVTNGGGSMPASGYTNINPLLAADPDGVYHLQSGSPAIGTATGTYSAVTFDMDGQARPSSGKDKGADEVSGATATAWMLTTDDVGPAAGLSTPAAAPSFNPAAGTYTGTQSVTIASASSGVSIRYTTDGSTPTATTGTVYSGAVSISQNTTLKALAYGGGFTDSSVTTGVYGIRVSAPVPNPSGGTFTSAQSVSLSTATSGASMRYTLDGSTPTATTGTLYGSPFTVSSTSTLRALGYKAGMTDSTLTTASFTISSPGGTTITNANGFVNVALSSTQTGTFTATVSASPSISPSNAVVGLSSGAATGYTGIAVMARFNTTGTIDARNGSGFTTGTVPFSAGVTYTFRFVVNVATRTYSAYVTPAGGSEQTLGTNLAFRTEQAAVTSLTHANFNVNATPGGAMTYWPVSISGGPASPAKFTIAGASVTASADDGNVPANTVDGSLATRWSANGDGQWIRYDLGSSKTISYVKVAFYSGDVRTSTFDVQTSPDGTTWTTRGSFTSSGTSLALETFDFTDVSARYVRLFGHGNSVNLWNSYTEAEVWGL
jgi:poly(beta-D-mannuronate) lyase